jgi:hypothetical protein
MVGVALLCAAMVAVYAVYQERNGIYIGRLYGAKSEIAALDAVIDESDWQPILKR